MDSSKHAEILSMTVETDEGPRKFDYIYCEGYEMDCYDDADKHGVVVVLSRLTEIRAPKSEREARQWWPSMICYRPTIETSFPVAGAVDFLNAVRERYSQAVILDLFSAAAIGNDFEMDSHAIQGGHFDPVY